MPPFRLTIYERVCLAIVVLLLGLLHLVLQASGVLAATVATLLGEPRAGVNALLVYDSNANVWPLLGLPGQTVSARTAEASLNAGGRWRRVALWACRVLTWCGRQCGSMQDHCTLALHGAPAGTEFWRWSRNDVPAL